MIVIQTFVGNTTKLPGISIELHQWDTFQVPLFKSVEKRRSGDDPKD